MYIHTCLCRYLNKGEVVFDNVLDSKKTADGV